MSTNTEQLFQSKHLAAEIEHIWDGAVLSNSEQSLSELEKATARENIGAVAFGTLLRILGHFETVTSLRDVITNPRVGDAYSVGSDTPYNLYIFDGRRGEWLDYGQIRAADISSRYKENVAAMYWEFDDSLYEDFQWKGKLLIDDITVNDFPIVAFEPKEASSGDFSPLCYARDGYVEIWARAMPWQAPVIAPVVTYIVNAGNGKGITNASSGLTKGSITTDKLSNGAVTRAKLETYAVSYDAEITLETEYWSDENTLTCFYSFEGFEGSDVEVTAKDWAILDVDLSLVPTSLVEEVQNEFSKIYRMELGNEQFKFYATSKPTIDLPVKILVIRK